MVEIDVADGICSRGPPEGLSQKRMERCLKW